MQVILLKELQGRGGEGDVINVARGFANNYLLTQGIAVKATKGNLKQLEQRRANIAKREEERVANANELAAKLNDLKVHIKAQVGEEGQLFGSVTSSMIADGIKQEHDIDVDRRRVELGKPIKVVGEYQVPINIYRSIAGTVSVVVSGDETLLDDKAEVNNNENNSVEADDQQANEVADNPSVNEENESGQEAPAE